VFSNKVPVYYPTDMKPILLVVIDTEEEFDWKKPVNSSNCAVGHMDYLDRCQDIFNEYNIVPCYVVDYPIVSQQAGCRLLKKFHSAGQCEIGAHLHPWVNPPFAEGALAAQSYPGNLPFDLELEKMRVLKSLVDTEFGQNTKVYKAGRHGFGPNTEHILQLLGFEIDVSVSPPVDYSQDGGPDYTHYTAHPFWFGQNRLLELPMTGAFVGNAGRYSPDVYKLAQTLKKMRVPGILSRLNVVDRLVLSPEGFNQREHRKLTEALFKTGSRVFTWSFHSPSLVPGHTMYVKNDKELTQFLGEFRRFFDFFFGELAGVSSTPTKIREILLNNVGR